jgi:hypothetical protein
MLSYDGKLRSEAKFMGNTPKSLRRFRLLVCALTLWIGSVPGANAASINVLDSTYSVTLRWLTQTGEATTPSTRTTTDTAPVSDALMGPGYYYAFDGATSSAEMFEVSTWTLDDRNLPVDGNLSAFHAYATTTLTFKPIISQTALIDVSFLLGGESKTWSESDVSLVDVTTATTIWTLGWGWRDYLTALTVTDAPTTMATEFDASHVYRLTLFGHTGSRDDSQTLTAKVAGLQAVPEPSTLLLVGIGAGAAAVNRRRRSRRHV